MPTLLHTFFFSSLVVGDRYIPTHRETPNAEAGGLLNSLIAQIAIVLPKKVPKQREKPSPRWLLHMRSIDNESYRYTRYCYNATVRHG